MMIAAGDAVNGCFEALGAVMTWKNVAALRRDRTIKGVYWPVTAEEE